MNRTRSCVVVRTLHAYGHAYTHACTVGCCSVWGGVGRGIWKRTEEHLFCRVFFAYCYGTEGART